MDTIPLYKGDKTRLLTTYHFFLEKVKKEGIANQSQFLAFLKTEDRLFRTFLSHLYQMSDVSVSHITSGTEDVCNMIAQSSRKGNLPARDAVAYRRFVPIVESSPMRRLALLILRVERLLPLNNGLPIFG